MKNKLSAEAFDVAGPTLGKVAAVVMLSYVHKHPYLQRANHPMSLLRIIGAIIGAIGLNTRHLTLLTIKSTEFSQGGPKLKRSLTNVDTSRVQVISFIYGL